MRHRLLAWSTAASMVAGLAASAATFGLIRHAPADLRLTATDDDRAAPTTGAGGAGVGGDLGVDGGLAGEASPDDSAGGDGLAAARSSVLITPMPLGDLASLPDADTRGLEVTAGRDGAGGTTAAPDGAQGATAGASDGAGGGTGGPSGADDRGETVVLPDATGMAGVDPAAVVTADSTTPVELTGGTAAQFGSAGNGGALASLGGGGGGCGNCGFTGGGTGNSPGSGGTSGGGSGGSGTGGGSGGGPGPGGSVPPAPGGPGTAVPEPGTWLLLTIGFGLVGAARRYRSVSTAASTASTVGRTL